MKSEWKFKITQPEKIWLKACYKHLVDGKELIVRSLRAQLYPEIPGSFNPSTIDKRLLVGGGQITILGVLQVDENTPYYKLCENFLLLVKSLIIENPQLNEIKPEMISDFDPKVAFNIMTLIGHMGSFWRGYSHNNSGVSNITIGDDDVYNEYLNFTSLEKIIDRQLIYDEEEAHEGDLIQFSLPEIEETKHPFFRSQIRSVDKKLAFVLMPFSQPWSNNVWNTIRLSVEDLGIQCLRADLLYGPIVIEDIWIKIHQSAFIIADVTGTNPNVMYEIGLVHAIGKHSVLLCQETEHIPFDFRHLRHFFYQYSEESVTGISGNLKNAINHIYQEHYQGILPIT